MGLPPDMPLTAVRKQALPAVAAASAGQEEQRTSRAAQFAAAFGGVLAGAFGASCVASAGEVSDGLHPPQHPWPHEGVLDSYDHASIRRGHKVCAGVQGRRRMVCCWRGRGAGRGSCAPHRPLARLYAAFGAVLVASPFPPSPPVHAFQEHSRAEPVVFC